MYVCFSFLAKGLSKGKKKKKGKKGKKGRKASESEDEPVYPSYEIAQVIDLDAEVVSYHHEHLLRFLSILKI